MTAMKKRQATWAKAKNTSSPRAKSRGRKGKDKDKAKERASGGSNKRLGGYSDDMEEKARAKAKAKSKDTARARENARKAGRAKAKAKARKVDRRKLQREHEREGKLGLRHERLSERRSNWRQNDTPANERTTAAERRAQTISVFNTRFRCCRLDDDSSVHCA